MHTFFHSALLSTFIRIPSLHRYIFGVYIIIHQVTLQHPRSGAMLKTHVVAILLVYFLALHDHTINHDHVHVEKLEVIFDKQRAR